MADKKWDWSHPGVKEIAVVAVPVFVLAMVYFWWKQQQAASTAAAASTTSGTSSTPTATSSQAAGPTPTGLSMTQFLSALTSSQSAPAAPSATAGPPATSTVSTLDVSNVNPTSAIIHWNAIPGATSYAVSEAKPQAKALAPTSGNSVTVTGLQPGTNYTYYVAAKPSVSGTGHGTITFTTPGTPK